MRKIVILITRVILLIYYKEIQIIGLENVPKNIPTIIVANHSNLFVDAYIIGAFLSRNVMFVTAMTTHNQKVAGFFSRLFGHIPVDRPKDIAYEGKGRIELLSDTHVRGIDTLFTKQAKVNETLLINGYIEFRIIEIVPKL